MKQMAILAALALLTVGATAQWATPDLPAYHPTAPPHGKPLPPLLAGTDLSGDYFTHPYQVTAYQMAAKVPAVLYQLPCYCRCDRALGHKSLHSCFEGTHGAVCSTCMKEGVFAYRQTRLGKSPAQIRTAIERGDWMEVDLEALSSINDPVTPPGQ